VKILKETLSKKLVVIGGEDGGSAQDGDVEAARDILKRLDDLDVSMEILTETLIGTVVSKLKNHETLGASAKALVKKWKKIAKASSAGGTPASSAASNGGGSAASSSSAAAAASAAKVVQPKEIIRRESTCSAGGESQDPSAEWAELPEHRQNICTKIHSFLVLAKPDLVKRGVNADAVDHLCGPRAAEIESAVFEKFEDKKAYVDKARSLAFNLKKNRDLCQDVILGSIQAENLVSMSSEELASAETKKARDEEAKKLIDSKRLDWDQANEDKINEMCGIKGDLLKASLFTCGRCKSVKTTSTQKQTRSADEPMTVFVLCLNCGKRWKC